MISLSMMHYYEPELLRKSFVAYDPEEIPMGVRDKVFKGIQNDYPTAIYLEKIS